MKQYPKCEEGQSIIILALAMVVLLAFVGMAIDVGLLYGRRIQLQRAVDAAALAGVIELPDMGDAEEKAHQFMRLNGFEEGQYALALDSAIASSNILTITAQMQMETMFLRFVGWRVVRVPALAVAEFKSLIEVYASQHPESGVTGAVNLNVFGMDANSQWGDAFTPRNWSGPWDCRYVPVVPNPYWRELNGVYSFRIHVPVGYEPDELQIEILDPDSWNNDAREVTYEWVAGNVERTVAVPGGRGVVAAVETGDLNNPVWLVRIDQYLAFCQGMAYPTRTRYTLYYYKAHDLKKHKIAVYEVGDDRRTDLQWIVPDGFRFALNDYPRNEDGSRSFFVDVEGLAGTYGNGFDFWAGAPPKSPLPADVNERNLVILRSMLEGKGNPHEGVGIWAVGYLPLNVNLTTQFTVTLGYLPPNVAGARVKVSSWDLDSIEAECRCEMFGHSCLGEQLTYLLEGTLLRVEGHVSCSTQWNSDIVRIPDEFYGGYLYAVYKTRTQDTTDWRLEYLDAVDDSYVRLIK